MKLSKLFLFGTFFVCTVFLSVGTTFAASTTGYAWSENVGWIDFSQVTVGDTALSGYAYSPTIGWISLNCNNTNSCSTAQYAVVHSDGTLSGYAWSENTGWIDFAQVNIDPTTGVFGGYAYSPTIGWVSLNCNNTTSCTTVGYKVTTAWRALVVPTQKTMGGIAYCTDTIKTFCRPRPQVTSPAQLPLVATPTLPPATVCTLNFTQILKLTSPLMNNTAVKALQTCLNTKAVASPSLTADGVFGIKTKQAIMAFQKNNTIKTDGIVGTTTRNKLMNK